MSLITFITAPQSEKQENWVPNTLEELKKVNYSPLQLCLRHLCLQRNKDCILNDLPEINHDYIHEPLSDWTLDRYNDIYKEFISSSNQGP